MLNLKVNYKLTRKEKGRLHEEAHLLVNGVDVSDRVYGLSIDFEGGHPVINMKLLPDNLEIETDIDEKAIPEQSLEILQDWLTVHDKFDEE